MEFKEILKNKDILKVIEEKGFINPTEIQEKVIPFILEGNDVLGQSQTGTGKTLAFASPIISKLEENKKIQTLILAPTRELAIQIARDFEILAKYTKIKVTTVYGSSSIRDQIDSLKNGSEVVIGTPGRLKDLIDRKVLKLENIKYFVLDEADEMLSMGFQEELEYIFDHTKKDKQVLLFSATMDVKVLTIARKYMNSDYKTVKIKGNQETADNIEQFYYVVTDKTRVEAMCRVMDYYNSKRSIIFCRTKKNADDVFTKLSNRGYSVDIIHGDITQAQRIKTLDNFKAGFFNYLIATDVAARGIHVDDVEVVFNYNLPETNEAYVHRIGRTGRVKKAGIAVTFIKESDTYIINTIEKHINCSIKKETIPTINDIIPNRVNEIKEHINTLINNDAKTNYFNEYIDKLTKDELKNIVNQLLQKELISNLGSDFSIDINKELKDTKKKKKNTSDGVRIFLTIGKMDKIDKKEFLAFIEKKANVPMNTCTSVEIMTKFTFMSVREEYFDDIMNKCNNIKYNGRIIKIEKAKK